MSNLSWQRQFRLLVGSDTRDFLTVLLSSSDPLFFSEAQYTALRTWMDGAVDSRIWHSIGINVIFRFMNYAIFASPVFVTSRNDAASELMSQLPVFLEFYRQRNWIVSKESIFEFWAKTSIIGKEVAHAVIGTRKVSYHAWSRFCERSHELPALNQERAALFQRLFAASKLVALCEKRRIRRVIANDFQRALYLETGALRFVVGPWVGDGIRTVEEVKPQ